MSNSQVLFSRCFGCLSLSCLGLVHLPDDLLVMLLVKMALLLHILELLSTDPSVVHLLVLIDELGEVPLVAVLDAEDVLVGEQQVDDVLSLLGVVAQDLDRLIMVVVDVDALVVNLGYVELLLDSYGVGVNWVACV